MSPRTLTLSFLSLLVLVALTIAAIPRADAAPASDDLNAVKKDKLASVAKQADAFGAAWNAHDSKAMATLWATDGDLIDPWGMTSVGRENVEKFFTEEHSSAGKLAKVTYTVKSRSARLITGDIALDDWQVVLTGLNDKDGKAMGPQFHRVVIVWKLDGGKWEIAAARPGLPTLETTEIAPAAPTKPGKVR